MHQHQTSIVQRKRKSLRRQRMARRVLPFLASLFAKREALAVHAVATPYRGRSHFDVGGRSRAAQLGG